MKQCMVTILLFYATIKFCSGMCLSGFSSIRLLFFCIKQNHIGLNSILDGTALIKVLALLQKVLDNSILYGQTTFFSMYWVWDPIAVYPDTGDTN